MRFFDLHADIAYDLICKLKKGINDELVQVHLKKFKKANLGYVCMASFFEGHETWEEMQAMILELRRQLATCDDFHLVLKPNDFKEDKINVIMSVEGMCGIDCDVRKRITWLYDQGVRLATLTWNDQNALATGVGGNPHRGLTVLGKEALQVMRELKMIVDVSHLNEQSFWDIMDFDIAVIASHSNCYSLCDHRRNLKDEQIHALLKKKALIGMNCFPPFVSKTDTSLQALIKHMEYLKTINHDVTCIAFGFDFMDYFEEGTLDLDGFHDVCDVHKLLEAMKQIFSEEELKKIAYQNAIDYFNQHL